MVVPVVVLRQSEGRRCYSAESATLAGLMGDVIWVRAAEVSVERGGAAAV